jgi:hypothetical protein
VPEGEIVFGLQVARGGTGKEDDEMRLREVQAFTDTQKHTLKQTYIKCSILPIVHTQPQQAMLFRLCRC